MDAVELTGEHCRDGCRLEVRCVMAMFEETERAVDLGVFARRAVRAG